MAARAVNVMSLCAGLGGLELGLRLAGVRARTVCVVEREAFVAACLVREMLEGRLDDAPVWAVAEIRKPWVRLHLLGISRVEHVLDFADLGVASFDSTSPLRQAFKDERDNYYTLDGSYSAIRIPQVSANPKLTRRIRAGEVDQSEALRLERSCLDGMAAYDIGMATIDEVLASLREYEALYDGKRSRVDRYCEVLEARPWNKCSCDVCKSLRYHVILFRGAERNRRRGFHNVYVLNQRLHRTLKGV